MVKKKCELLIVEIIHLQLNESNQLKIILNFTSIKNISVTSTFNESSDFAAYVSFNKLP